MKIISLSVGILTILLLLSTLICGFWIKSKGLTNDASSLAFHAKIGIASVILGSLSAIFLIIQAIKH